MLIEHAAKYGWKIYIPKFGYTTDNAAMIAITGYYKFWTRIFAQQTNPHIHGLQLSNINQRNYYVSRN